MNDNGADDRDVAMAASLRLRLRHSHGNARAGVLPIPAGGAGMAGALELGGERLSEAQWRAANLCRIAPQGQGWQLSNGSPTLVCAVNGERVLAQWPITLSAGDTLELGLLRFEVEGEGAPTDQLMAQRVTGGESEDFGPAAQAALPTPDAELAATEFNLRDLAFVARDGSGSDLDDLFGVLDIAGAEHRPVGDPLAELLGEKPPPPTTSASSYARAAQVPQHEAEPHNPDSDAKGRLPDAPENLPTGTPAPTDVAGLLLNSLHAEFVRVVRDPTQLTGRTDWDQPVVAAGVRQPTIDELSQAAAPYHLLRDILQSREGIDQILDEFLSLGPATLLEASDTEDVLRLFAPKLARGAKTAVPSLTRREHHDMSPDSHMELGAFRPDDNISS